MITILHNPRCSKSRETLEILKNNGVQPEVIEYLKGIDRPLVEKVVSYLGLHPRDLIRTKEEVFSTLKLDLDNDSKVIDAIVAHPILLERPIVIKGQKAVIGRPPENVLELLK